MKLWILRPVENLPKERDPWRPWYDKAFGFIVRAEDEIDARDIAHANAGDENYELEYPSDSPWINQEFSTCVELVDDGEPGIIMRDFQSA